MYIKIIVVIIAVVLSTVALCLNASDNLSDIFLYKEYNVLSQMQCIEILAYGERKQREIVFQLVSENVSVC